MGVQRGFFFFPGLGEPLGRLLQISFHLLLLTTLYRVYIKSRVIHKWLREGKNNPTRSLHSKKTSLRRLQRVVTNHLETLAFQLSFNSCLSPWQLLPALFPVVSVSGRDVLISFMKSDRSKPPAYTRSVSGWPDGAVLLYPVPLVEFIVPTSLVESARKGFCMRSGCLCFILLVNSEWSSAEWRFFK